MSVFAHILVNNVLPLTMMIVFGILIQKAFSLDIRTLTKLNFYLFTPAVVFKSLYTTDIALSVISHTLIFFFVFMLAQFLLLELVIWLRGYKGGMIATMRNSVQFYNSANYGIPLNQLAFAGNPYTLSIQVLMMMMQSLVPNTYGVYLVNAHRARFRDIWKTIISMPVIYVIPLAFLMRAYDVPIPDFVETPIGYLSDAFLGTALITLGVQLGSMSWKIRKAQAVDVAISSGLRLVAGPLIAWLIVSLMDLPSLMKAALIVSSAVPTGLNCVLLAVEYDNEPEFASQAVFFSTLLSIVTVSVVISLLHIPV